MKFELPEIYLDELRAVIEEKNDKRALDMLEGFRPADIAGIYKQLSIEEAKYLYLLLDGDRAADVLSELEEDDRERFLRVLPSKIIARQFIDNMDSDDAADILSELPEDVKDEIISHIEEVEHAGDIVDLLNYEEDTAGGLMAKELISVNLNWSVTKCLREMARQVEQVDEVYYVYVVDDDNILKGLLSLKKLLLTQTSAKVSSVYNPDVISVRTDTKGEEVANIMDRYDLVALPVVDGIGRLMGRITIDDVVDFIREEAEKDYQMISGITEDVEARDNVFLQTRARLPWLLIGLVGGIFGALVIGSFEGDLRENAAMALFFPLIAAMGGNVGVQSSSIVVQGLANQSLRLESTATRILKELGVALINGLVCSTIILLYNIIFTDSFVLTITVSSALMIVILFASIFGTIVPLALEKFKIDPALATGPFITTVNDILGLFIYLITGRLMYTLL